MKERPDAIVIGVDSGIGLTIVRELGQHGVPVHGVATERKAIGSVSRYCASTLLRPAGSFAQWLPGLIARTGAQAVLAVSETDLLALAQLPPMIGACRILVPRLAQLMQVIDKRRTLEVAAEVGLLVPRTWQPTAGDDFTARAAEMEYPMVVKWANSPEVIPLLERAGLQWIKVEYVRSPAQLVAILERYRPTGTWPLVQQYCSGIGLGQMLHMENDRSTLRFQHRRLHEWPPAGGVSTLCAAEPPENHTAQMALSEKLLTAIKWEGPAMVEYRYEAESEKYWLMEVNGRFWGSLPLAYHSNAHFAWESYRRAVLEDRAEPRPSRHDLRTRYMIPETKRLLLVLFARNRIGDPFFRPRPIADLWTYISGFFDRRMRYFVFSLDDPWPWFRDIRQMMMKALRLGKP